MPPEKLSDLVKKHDLEFILEVNRKAIEIETEVAEQNEEIVDSLTQIKKTQVDQDKKIDALIKQSDEANKDLFRIQVLFVTGLLSLVIQIIQMLQK